MLQEAPVSVVPALLMIVGGTPAARPAAAPRKAASEARGGMRALSTPVQSLADPAPMASEWERATEAAARPASPQASPPASPWARSAEPPVLVAAEALPEVDRPDTWVDAAAGVAVGLPKTPPDAPAPPDLAPAARRWRLEELFGARLPVWGGGIAIAFAGIFLVRYAIDLGLLTPLVRVALGASAGVALLALAEASRALPATRSDPRIAQALAGAGIVSLHAVIHLAIRSYCLVAATSGILGMGAVTAVALLMAWRHGPLTARLGLVGGLMTPAVLATDDGSVPLLLLYLAAVIAGMVTLGRLRSWAWLSALGLAAGLLWAMVILAVGDDAGDLRALALFLLGVAIVALLARPEVAMPERLRPAMGADAQPLVSLTLAALASVLLVSATTRAGLTPADWLLQAALGVAAVTVAARDPRLVPLPLLGLALSLSSLIGWPDPPGWQPAAVALGMTLVYAPAGFLLLHRHPDNRLLLLLAPLAAAAPVLAARGLSPAAMPDAAWALAALMAAVPPALAVCAWAKGGDPDDAGNRRLLVALGATLVLAGLIVALLLPRPWVPAGFAALGLTLVLALPRLSAARAALLALAPAAAALLWGLFGMGPDATMDAQLRRILLASGSRAPLAVILGQAVAAGLLLISALRLSHPVVAASLATASMALAILATGQALPLDWRPAVIALLAVALLAGGRRLACEPLVMASIAAALFLALAISLPALVQMQTTVVSRMIASAPVLRTDLPGPWVASARLLLPGLLFGRLFLHLRGRGGGRTAVAAAAAGVALAAGLYILLKQPFAIDSAQAFLGRGLAERAVITAVPLLAGLALLRWRPGWQLLAIALLALGGARLLLLDGIFYNPFFVAQSLGRLPILNFLLVAYALPAAIFLAARLVSQTPRRPLWHVTDAAAIATALMFGLASVAHAFRGPVIAVGVPGNAELTGYSAVAIVTALAALAWGTRTDNQLFRIASLILLLGAVVKVFLFDAAALDGLLRVVSFLGLGLALIAVSWFYTRHVFARAKATQPAG
jgi:uncharacterized membrane protein